MCFRGSICACFALATVVSANAFGQTIVAGPGPAKVEAEGSEKTAAPPVVQVKKRKIEVAPEDLSTPAAGFVLGRRKVGVQMELGYPFLDFRFGYGLGSRVQLLLGYRGFYSMTSSGYAGMRFGLFSTPSRSVGLSLAVLGGYHHVRFDYDYTTALTGGNGAFGEAMISVTGRRGRHGLFAGMGLRLSQVRNICSQDDDDCDSIVDPDLRIMLTIIGEIGWEVRIHGHMSYYIALGVDMFANSNAIPAMVRFRTGLMMDF